MIDMKTCMWRIGPTYAPPTRYLHWAVVCGDTDPKEAERILVDKYGFGPQGARNSVKFALEHPHRIHKPSNYDAIFGPEGTHEFAL